VVRAPLLPIDAYLEVDNSPRTDEPTVRTALIVGSSDLFDAAERPFTISPTVAGKLRRYLTRMSTRPTPYGMFAGVGLARWGRRTDIALAAEAPRTRTRPDMEWLLSVIFALEARPEVRRQLRFAVDRNVVVSEGRALLASPAPNLTLPAANASVSIRATSTVLKVFDIARTPVPFTVLVEELLDAPAATTEKVEQLLTRLWEQSFLLSDLRPPVTVTCPARWVAQRLETIPEARDEHGLIVNLLDAMALWDNIPARRTAAGYKELQELARRPPAPVGCKHAVQVDMAHNFQTNDISAAVAATVATAAELLLRVTPLPRGAPQIEAYRHAFEHRYGTDVEVPIVELLHSETGLGNPYQNSFGNLDPRPDRTALRERTLRDLALNALHNHQRAVVLDDATVNNLQTWGPNPTTAPPSLDIPVFVAAADFDAIDSGDFRVVIGPNVGAVSAGQGMGRFCDLLGGEATAALRNVARAEHARDPDAVSAELSYLPQALRSANVVVRPFVRDYEIVVGTAPASADREIPLDELTVRVEGGRFRLRWSTTSTDVLVYASHMLNTHGAPTVCRFLSDLAHDGVAQLSPFSWGSSADLPYLPRVECGQIVLSLAQWRFDTRVADTSTSTFRATVDRWRADWQVPRFVYLAAGDNRLLLDLDNSADVAELHAEARTSPSNSRLLIQEALPGPNESWLPGVNGSRFMAELVVSLCLSSTGRTSAQQRGQLTARHTARPSSRQDRLRPPGSDWLYAKLYCPADRQDDFLIGPMNAFCHAVESAGLADHWLFIRYADPDPHIRLRFKGSAESLTTVLLPQLCTWTEHLIVENVLSRSCIDTYEREVDRYGGPDATDAAERLFAADSQTAISLISKCRSTDRQPAVDPTIASILNIDALLDGMGLDVRQRLDFYQEYLVSKNESGSDYRNRKSALRKALATPDEIVGDAFKTRQPTLRLVRASLDDLSVTQELDQPLDRLLASYVHMSCNRLSGPIWPSEQRIMGLLLRTRTALIHAPITHAE
jgi:thiopeptide-type bacteriocin biosynthesis protein